MLTCIESGEGPLLLGGRDEIAKTTKLKCEVENGCDHETPSRKCHTRTRFEAEIGEDDIRGEAENANEHKIRNMNEYQIQCKSENAREGET